jgi:hypothetical protein
MNARCLGWTKHQKNGLNLLRVRVRRSNYKIEVRSAQQRFQHLPRRARAQFLEYSASSRAFWNIDLYTDARMHSGQYATQCGVVRRDGQLVAAASNFGHLWRHFG